MRRAFIVVAAVVLACGCVYEEAGKPAGAVAIRNGLASPMEDGLENGRSHEVAGVIQHTARFAMEYSAGLERYDGDPFDTSTMTGGSVRFTPTFSNKFGESVILRVGGGLTMKDLEYRIGHDELVALAAANVNNAELDVNVAGGFHLQFEALFAAENGFAMGLLVRHTFLEAKTKLKWDDGGYFELDDTMDLGGTEIGISLGAAF